MKHLGAILLAGGRGSRMGGADKPLLEVAGVTLLDAAIDAARAAGAQPIVVVGPVADERSGITRVREDPPFGGPVAAILAALPLVSASRTLVLACDLPLVGAAVRLLLATPDDRDGACLIDESGRRQWLTGVYRTDALRAAAGTIPDRGRDASARDLLGEMSITAVAATDDVVFDIDTWDDLHKARLRSAKEEP